MTRKRQDTSEASRYMGSEVGSPECVPMIGSEQIGIEYISYTVLYSCIVYADVLVASECAEGGTGCVGKPLLTRTEAALEQRFRTVSLSF